MFLSNLLNKFELINWINYVITKTGKIKLTLSMAILKFPICASGNCRNEEGSTTGLKTRCIFIAKPLPSSTILYSTSNEHFIILSFSFFILFLFSGFIYQNIQYLIYYNNLFKFNFLLLSAFPFWLFLSICNSWCNHTKWRYYVENLFGIYFKIGINTVAEADILVASYRMLNWTGE